MTTVEIDNHYADITARAVSLGLDVNKFETPEQCEEAIAEEEERLTLEKRIEEAEQADRSDYE